MNSDIPAKVKEMERLTSLRNLVIKSGALYDENGDVVFLSDAGVVLFKEALTKEIRVKMSQLEALIKVDEGTYL